VSRGRSRSVERTRADRMRRDGGEERREELLLYPRGTKLSLYHQYGSPPVPKLAKSVYIKGYSTKPLSTCKTDTSRMISEKSTKKTIEKTSQSISGRLCHRRFGEKEIEAFMVSCSEYTQDKYVFPMYGFLY
jgi:hypothetical protein